MGEGRDEGERETFFNARCLADLSRQNPMKADEGGTRRENWRASLRLRDLLISRTDPFPFPFLCSASTVCVESLVHDGNHAFNVWHPPMEA